MDIDDSNVFWVKYIVKSSGFKIDLLGTCLGEVVLDI